MLIILPTDTCYGLAWWFNEQDYHEIYRLKGRDFDKRLAFLVRDFDMLREYAEVSDEQIEFLRSYPHPWSVILPKKSSWALPDFLDASQYAQISFRVASECLKSSPTEKMELRRVSGSSPDKGRLGGVSQKGIVHGVTHPHPPLSWRELEYPLFLTSANLSGGKESTTLEQAKTIFPWIEWIDGGICDRPPSDIFRFLPSGEAKYLRKNY